MTQACPYGPVSATGLLKSCAQDFIVVEELGFEPEGEGEHLFLWIEKAGMNTMELIDRVARDYAVHPRLIGHSGLKDRNALSRQWLSLHLPGKPAEVVATADDYRVLRQLRHRSKLRPGSHRGNRFDILVREVDRFGDDSRRQLDCIGAQGFANYFGAQRFGRRDNVQQALAQLGRKRLSRQRRSLLISSLRSDLFNRILATRIDLGYWDEPLNGDVFMLRGSRSIFSEALDDSLRARYRALDISPSASLYGNGESLLSGLPREIEERVFEQEAPLCECLLRQGAKRQMRALRATVDDFDYAYDDSRRQLRLQARLPAGSYLTSLLDHFIVTRDRA